MKLCLQTEQYWKDFTSRPFKFNWLPCIGKLQSRLKKSSQDFYCAKIIIQDATNKRNNCYYGFKGEVMRGKSRGSMKNRCELEKHINKTKSFSIIILKEMAVIFCRCTERTLRHFANSCSGSHFLLSRGIWLKSQLSWERKEWTATWIT